MLKLTFDPQSTNITVDMLYYKITADDCTREGEMTVKYAACLQQILNPCLHYKN